MKRMKPVDNRGIITMFALILFSFLLAAFFITLQKEDTIRLLKKHAALIKPYLKKFDFPNWLLNEINLEATI